MSFRGTGDREVLFDLSPSLRPHIHAQRGLGGFRGTYLGDIDRLKDIQSKRDVTNRDFQRFILRDVWDRCIASEVGSTRDILMSVYGALEEEEYSNMLLLHRMMALLEEEVRDGKESKIGKFITKEGYEAMMKKVRGVGAQAKGEGAF